MAANDYDENISENKFYIQLKEDHKILLETAPLEGWIVCVPRIGSIQGVDIKDPEFLLAHIFISHDELPETHFTNLIGQSIKIFDKKIYVSESSAALDTDNTVTSHQIEVNILFEEIFYTKDMQKFKVWCIDEPIKFKSYMGNYNIDGNHASVTDTAEKPQKSSHEEDIQLYLIRSHHDSINFMINEIASKQIISKIDKIVQNFNRNPEMERYNLQQLQTTTRAMILNCISIAKSSVNVNRNSQIDGHYLKNVELAIETYCVNLIFPNLFNRITLIYLDETQNFNKILRNLADVHISHFQINANFASKIPFVKIELNKVGGASNFVDKLNCIRQAYNVASAGNNQLTVDDFIPILVFVIVKSGLPHWIPNLMFLMEFCFTDLDFGSDRFLITTLEAAIRFIQTENVFRVNEHEKHRLLPSSLDIDEVARVDNPKAKFLFEKVVNNDEHDIINYFRESNDSLNGNFTDLCHPLCNCSKCHVAIGKSQFTVDCSDSNGVTAIHIASMYGLPKMINLLLALGANVNAIDMKSRSPLHYACSNGKQNSVLLLLHANANPNIRDNDGNLPLHLASLNGHENCAKAVLYFSDHMKLQLDINARNNIGNTALHFASKWGFNSIVETLLEYGADSLIKNDQHQMAQDTSHNSLIQDLLENGFVHLFDDTKTENSSIIRNTSNINSTSFEQMVKIDKINQAIADNDTNLALFYLNFDSAAKCHPLCTCDNCRTISRPPVENHKLDINTPNSLGLTPLHAAAFHNNNELIEALLRNHADPFIKSRSGQTPLHLACLAGKVNAVQKLLELMSNSTIHEKDNLGNTPLHIAVEHNNLKIIDVLLKFNPNRGLRNLKGDRPVDIAKRMMLLTIVEKLK